MDRNKRWEEKARAADPDQSTMSPGARRRWQDKHGAPQVPPVVPQQPAVAPQKPAPTIAGFDPQNYDNLRRQLHLHEGTVWAGSRKCVGGGQKGNMCVYNDSKNIPTVGYGRNLRDNPITASEWSKMGGKRDIMKTGLTQDEADMLLENDIALTNGVLAQQVPAYAQLDPVRRRALLDMTFNMGMAKLQKFVTMLKGINLTDANGNWTPDFKMAAANVTGNFASNYDYKTGKGVYLGKTDYYNDVGYRAENVKHMIETGQDLPDFMPSKVALPGKP